MRRLVANLERLAVPNLTLVLTVGSALCLALSAVQPELLSVIALVPDKVMQGEVWRLVTFVFYPMSTHPIFAAFTYYLFYLMGTTLETEWGAAKFNLYMLLACVGAGIAAWWNPSAPAVNGFMYGTVFLAFAYLRPDFEFYLFFVLPVKVKWLAALEWAGYVVAFIYGDWHMRAAIAMTNANFFIFFGKSIVGQMRYARNEMEGRARDVREAAQPFHVCAVCGITEQQDRTMDFRVCPSCEGGKDYCRQHSDAHAHQMKS